jgi:hypothetical protein
MLDALYAAIVVANLNTLGVRDVVAIHDAFLSRRVRGRNSGPLSQKRAVPGCFASRRSTSSSNTICRPQRTRVRS